MELNVQVMVTLTVFGVIYNLISPSAAAAAAAALHEFTSLPSKVTEKDLNILNRIDEEKLKTYVQLGCDGFDRQSQLEENLINSQITVKNGSVSHVTLLERWPNKKAQNDNEIAMKILKSSLYVLNSECLKSNISPESCAEFLKRTPLPESKLREDCLKILTSDRDGHHPFRRLLPSNYKDSFYEMYSRHELPLPRMISSGLRDNSAEIDNIRNLILIQWSQFIEHDLSKTVATTMKSGSPIECCNTESFQLNPRNIHPACAPLIGTKSFNKYGPETCLNYVRSAVAVGSNCNFNTAEQLNQATGYFDLSQLYGFTKNVQREMRTFSNGQLKSTKTESPTDDLLPMVVDDVNAFCAVKMTSNATCYMAGDSRVNSNPFSVIIYTIFLRSHNQIATKLKGENSNWNDEQLFMAAKKINTAIYRQIIFNEWLPIILGQSTADAINSQSLLSENSQRMEENHISNEFAIAAIRFYFSMMPNALHRMSSAADRNEVHDSAASADQEVVPVNFFLLKDQIYKPTKLLSNSNKINRILQSMLNQRAMKMDARYVESLTEEYMKAVKPTRSDILAFDIQRGRDHGLQGYVKYLQECEGVVIKEWADLERFISSEDVNILRSLYSNLNDIDLIIGGISEVPLNGSTVGPTFTCILREQFLKINQWQKKLESMSSSSSSDLPAWHKNWTAAKLICANTGVHEVPGNAFEIPSSTNRLTPCSLLLNS